MTSASEVPQAGNIVHDILMALQRIERRLKRIEEHLGVEVAGEPTTPEPGARGTRRRESPQPGAGRRTSPYA